MDYWLQMQERSEQSNQVIEEYDNVTKLYGHKPIDEQILEMARHRGIIYQRRGKEGTSNSQPNFPKVTTPTHTPIANLNVDLGKLDIKCKGLGFSVKSLENSLTERKASASYKSSK
jgi:hypothetical protein